MPLPRQQRDAAALERSAPLRQLLPKIYRWVPQNDIRALCPLLRRIDRAEDRARAGSNTLTRIRQSFLQSLDAMLQRCRIRRLSPRLGKFIEDAQRVLGQRREIAFALREQVTKYRIALRRRRLRLWLLGVSCHVS